MDKKGVRFKFKKYYIIGLIIFSLIVTGVTYAFYIIDMRIVLL